MNDTQRQILLKLIHHPKLSFTQLLAGRRDSNLFAYHLTTLKEKNIIELNDGFYSLSDEGRKMSAFIEGDTGKKALFPTFVHGLIIEKDGKILVQKRLKEPFYGYWSLISGKINLGLNIEECANHDLTEETGLIANSSKIIGINQIKTLKDNNLSFHCIVFLVKLFGIQGELIEKTHKGINKWMTIEEYKKQKRFPDPWLDDVLNAKEFIFLETERTFENKEFVDFKIIKQR